jgi:hypothetical protein
MDMHPAVSDNRDKTWAFMQFLGCKGYWPDFLQPFGGSPGVSGTDLWG